MMNQKALLERLHKQSPVKIMLEPKRVAIDSSGHPSLGAKDAPVTIVEFTDFQCPFCKASENTLEQLRKKYGDKIRLVHMDFPLRSIRTRSTPPRPRAAPTNRASSGSITMPCSPTRANWRPPIEGGGQDAGPQQHGVRRVFRQGQV